MAACRPSQSAHYCQLRTGKHYFLLFSLQILQKEKLDARNQRPIDRHFLLSYLVQFYSLQGYIVALFNAQNHMKNWDNLNFFAGSECNSLEMQRHQ